MDGLYYKLHQKHIANIMDHQIGVEVVLGQIAIPTLGWIRLMSLVQKPDSAKLFDPLIIWNLDFMFNDENWNKEKERKERQRLQSGFRRRTMRLRIFF